MTVTMWKARFLDPFSDAPRDVQVPNMKLGEGATYYSGQYHKGHLCCAYCSAGVHYNDGSVSTLGNTAPGRKPHFVTQAHEKHEEDCLWKFREPSQSVENIDPAKGYRIHLNTLEYSDLFNVPSGVYEKGKIVDPDMHGRERLVMKTARDFDMLLEKGEWDRINNSVIIHRNEKFLWDDFCIHDGKWRRIFGLLERQKERPKDSPPVCLMQIKTDRPYSFRGYGKQEVPSRPVLMYERDERGKKQEIRTTVNIKNRHNTHVMNAFTAPGSYFVLAPVKYKLFEGDFKTIHYFNIDLTNIEQVSEMNIENVVARGRANALKRSNSGGTLPSMQP